MQWKQLPWRVITGAMLTLAVVLGSIAGRTVYRLQQHHNAKAWMIEQGVDGGDSFGHPLDRSQWEWVRRWSPRADHVMAVDEGDADPAEVLLRAQSLIDVEMIMLRGQTISGTEVDLLARLETLELLQLDGSSVHSAPLDALKHLPLRHVCLRHTDANDATLSQLAQLPHLDSLDIGETNVSEKAIRQFAAKHPQMEITWSPPLTPRQQQLVTELAAKTIHLDHEYVMHKINSERIVHVRMEQLPLAPALVIDMLCDAGVVTTLVVSSEAIGDDLLQELPRLKRLETLDIMGNEYTLAGLESLLKLEHLGRITCYGGPDDGSPEAIAAFRQRYRGVLDMQEFLP